MVRSISSSARWLSLLAVVACATQTWACSGSDVDVDARDDANPNAEQGVSQAPANDDDAEDGREMNDDDPSIVTYDEPRIDVAPLAREQCYLAIPMKPLCRPDCQGLCPQCGTNRNVATCTCENQWEDPRLAGLKSLLKVADESAPRE